MNPLTRAGRKQLESEAADGVKPLPLGTRRTGPEPEDVLGVAPVVAVPEPEREQRAAG